MVNPSVADIYSIVQYEKKMWKQNYCSMFQIQETTVTLLGQTAWRSNYPADAWKVAAQISTKQNVLFGIWKWIQNLLCFDAYI